MLDTTDVTATAVYLCLRRCVHHVVRDLGTGSLGLGDCPSKPRSVIRGQSELLAEQQNFIARYTLIWSPVPHTDACNHLDCCVAT